MTLVLTPVLLGGAYVALCATKEANWYNTMVAYPFGMAVCLLKGPSGLVGAGPVLVGAGPGGPAPGFDLHAS
jgi:hypothetical protein